MTQIQTTCPYCGVGCGLVMRAQSDGSWRVQGDTSHPANFGRLCVKGAHLNETLQLNDRLLTPEIHGKPVTWEKALDYVAQELQHIIAIHGKESVAFYVSGQLLTEDYYVANKFMKGFIGTANIDTNSRLCMASSVAGHKRAFGTDTVPGNYEDLEQADCIILVGSNLAWCHPVLYQRIGAAKQKNPKLQVINIDPRPTATNDIADLYLPLKAGSDAWLFNGLLHYLRQHDYLDYDFLDKHTEGFGEVLSFLKQGNFTIPNTAKQCGLSEKDIVTFYQAFAKNAKVVTVYSQGVNQSSSGTDKVNSIINCHLATGRIGKVGATPFSVTGQPNAMGGREVGALANQLAAHVEFSPEGCELVRTFWNAPTMATQAGLKAVDLFDAVAVGKIKAVWIMATNPVVSMPDADAVKRALKQCELVIVSECIKPTDTTECATVLLPALAWGERNGTVTNSERRISRQRRFLAPPEQAKADWWIISQIAQRLGFKEQFNYQSPADIFREYARLSGYENHGTRDFDISALGYISDEEYANLQPFQWSMPQGGMQQGTARFFTDGKFFTPSGKARFIKVEPRAPHGFTDENHSFVLNTGRVRDQWHTMTRTGKAARLLTHLSEPFIDLNPQDAEKLGIQEGHLVKVSNELGSVVVRARFQAEQTQQHVFIPIHWSGQFASAARVGALIYPYTDPISGQPEFKQTPVKVELFKPQWVGFVVVREALPLSVLAEVDFWVKIPCEGYFRYELAGMGGSVEWGEWVKKLCRESVDWLEYQDVANGSYRYAAMWEQRLEAAVFIHYVSPLPSRDGLEGLFLKEELSLAERLSLLAGQVQSIKAGGATVCTCFGVKRQAIVYAIEKQGLTTTAQVSALFKAGTNCGSCLPEIRGLLAKFSGG